MLCPHLTARALKLELKLTSPPFLPADVLVVFPLHIPLPRPLTNLTTALLRKLRILDSPSTLSADGDELSEGGGGEAKERVWFTLGLNSAPVLAVLVLLASQSIKGETVRMGIVGVEGGVRPYDISQSPRGRTDAQNERAEADVGRWLSTVLLFISLAYLSISLVSMPLYLSR